MEAERSQRLGKAMGATRCQPKERASGGNVKERKSDSKRACIVQWKMARL